MDTKEIHETTDVGVLKVRLHSKEVRKKERRLINRQIARLENAEIARLQVEEQKVETEKPIKIRKKKETVVGEPVKKPRAPRKKKVVEG